MAIKISSLNIWKRFCQVTRTLCLQDVSSEDFPCFLVVFQHYNRLINNKHVITTFRQALKEIMCEKMTEHEFITLIRYFRGDPGKEKSPRREMVRLVPIVTLRIRIEILYSRFV